MMPRLVLLGLVLAGTLPGCQAPAAATAQSCWQGRLLMVGNMPRPQAVLRTPQQDWRLQGLSQEQLMQYQHAELAIRGQVKARAEPATLIVHRLQARCP